MFVASRRTRGDVPVEVRHQVVRLLHVHPERALVQVGDQNAVAFFRDPKRVRLDRLRHAPPFLHDDHPGVRGVTAHVAGKAVAERDFLHREPEVQGVVRARGALWKGFSSVLEFSSFLRRLDTRTPRSTRWFPLDDG